MCSLDKTFFILAALFLFVYFSPLNAWSQPFGILSPQGQQETQKQVLSSPQGRFVFGQISDSGKDQFMLDTLTGRLWRISERGDIGTFLTGIPYCNPEGECSDLPGKISTPKKKKLEKD